MVRDPVLFELSLPALSLEGGGCVERHLVRGFWWGPDPDRDWLSRRTLLLDPASPDFAPNRVVRRTEDELAALAERCRGLEPLSPPPTDVPTVLVVHALTADMRVGGPFGWWPEVAGVRRALDPRHTRILCFNNLGSCYGTSGPGDQGFPRLADQPGAPVENAEQIPATVTTWDQARSILMALDRLGIGKVQLVVGGSVGGAVVLCLGALDPERFERLVPIAAAELSSPWVIGWNHVARQAILADPGFPDTVGSGLSLARQVAHLTYRAEHGLISRQGGTVVDESPLGGTLIDEPPLAEARWSARSLYQVQTYLDHQGYKLTQRFHGGSYLCLLGAIDHHDLGRFPGPPTAAETWPEHLPAQSPKALRPLPAQGWGRSDSPGDSWGLSRIRARVFAVSVDSDQLFFAEHMIQLAERLEALGQTATHSFISSSQGHDGFLIEQEQVGRILQSALTDLAWSPDQAFASGL